MSGWRAGGPKPIFQQANGVANHDEKKKTQEKVLAEDIWNIMGPDAGISLTAILGCLGQRVYAQHTTSPFVFSVFWRGNGWDVLGFGRVPGAPVEKVSPQNV